MSDRFMISAAASGSGKTLLTCGILQALQDQGKRAVSFKCGPDYIDPMFHSRILGTKSRNLDTFFAGDEVVRSLLEKNSRDCDIAVLEGVMGYYDGVGGTSVKASAYDVAQVTGTPVILAVNCKGASVSLVPMIKGFLEYRADSNIKGVILNQISPMLFPRMKALIEEQLPVKVAGYVPHLPECVFESRHLGLVLPDEVRDLKERIHKLASVLQETIHWKCLLEISKMAKDIPDGAASVAGGSEEVEIVSDTPVRIGVAKDEAFCFFYEDNFEFLRSLGAEIVWFSPLHDGTLPEQIDGLMFHGGYPELYAEKLSGNRSMLDAVRQAVKGGMPCMAECGGFMYLHEQMEDMTGQAWPMTGVIPGYVKKKDRLGRFGYITLEEGTVFGQATGPIPSHEFHYFDSDCCGEAFLAKKPESSRSWRCIHSTDTLFAGFPHMYFYGNPKVAQAFLTACVDRRNKR